MVIQNHFIIQMDGHLDPDGHKIHIIILVLVEEEHRHPIQEGHLVDDGMIKQIGMIQGMIMT